MKLRIFAAVFALIVMTACEGEQTVVVNGTTYTVSAAEATAIAITETVTAGEPKLSLKGQSPARVVNVGGRGACRITPRAWGVTSVLHWSFGPDGPYPPNPEASFSLTRTHGESTVEVFKYPEKSLAVAGQIPIADPRDTFAITSANGTWSYALRPADGTPALESYNGTILDTDQSKSNQARKRYCGS